MSKKSQSEKLLDYLKSGRSITSMGAYRLFNITQLGARIYELKGKGYNIRDEWALHPDTGKNAGFKKYRLVRSKKIR